MPRLFVGNFDFDHRFAFGGGPLPKAVERINADWSPIWAAVADDGDAVWRSATLDSAIFDQLADLGLPRLRPVRDPAECLNIQEVIFWGENDWAADFARRWRLPWTGNDPAVVRHVNSRRFKLALEQRLGVALSGSRLATTITELAQAIAAFPAASPGLPDRPALPNWVLKTEYGGAGREVRFGTGSLSAADIAWAKNRFCRRLAITVEPRLELVEEAGMQFTVLRDGGVTFEGVTPLLTRSGGGYLGSCYRDDPALQARWHEAIAIGQKTAEAVAAEGYFGPLGIDAMRYRAADGTIRLRPLQDLNARWTMGRIALGLRRFPHFAATTPVFRPEEFARTPRT
jgi:hypothetical protein